MGLPRQMRLFLEWPVIFVAGVARFSIAPTVIQKFLGAADIAESSFRGHDASNVEI